MRPAGSACRRGGSATSGHPALAGAYLAGTLPAAVLAVLLDARLPWGTILVNRAGSLLLGWCSGIGLSGGAMALLGTGFCGGLTTYSWFAVHTHGLGPRRGALNVLLTRGPRPAAAVPCGLRSGRRLIHLSAGAPRGHP
jgi:CrcB protein